MTMTVQEANGLAYVEMNPFMRFVNLFISPKETFQSLTRSRWAWIAPLLLSMLVGIAAYMVMKPYVVEEQLRRIEQMSFFQSMTAEQQEATMERVRDSMENPPAWQYAIMPIAAFIAVLIITGVLLLVGNIILGGQTKFINMLHVYSFSGLIAIPAWIVKTFLVMSKQNADVRTSLAVLVPSADTSSWAYAILNMADIFSIWTLTVIVIGMGVFIPNISPKKAAIWLVVFWLAWVVISTLLTKLTGVAFGM